MSNNRSPHNVYAVRTAPIPAEGNPATTAVKALRAIREARRVLVDASEQEPPEGYLDLSVIQRTLVSDAQNGDRATWVGSADDYSTAHLAAAIINEQSDGTLRGVTNPSEADLRRYAGMQTPEEVFAAQSGPEPELRKVSEMREAVRTMRRIESSRPVDIMDHRRAMVLLMQAQGSPLVAAASAYQMHMADPNGGWPRVQRAILSVFPWAADELKKNSMEVSQ